MLLYFKTEALHHDAIQRETAHAKRHQHLTRRHFIETAGKGAAALTAVQIVKGNPRASAANSTVGVGHIGLGVRGGTLISQVAGRQLGGGCERRESGCGL